ncbi:CASR protein, partial [Atractosteus spatula]|nr:CASR protein [Atractosteus spatula]
MRFAVEEINADEQLLSSLKLGYSMYDTCDSITKAVEEMFALVTGQDTYVPNYRCQMNMSLAAVIGESSSTISMVMARILGIYQYPQISYFSSIPVLSNKHEFPSFLRTIPSDNFQSKAFAYVVRYFGWKWVGTLAEDIAYGIQGVQLFTEKVKEFGTCIAFSERIPVVYSRERYVRVVEVIKNSRAKVIVVFSGETNMIPLVEEVARQNMTGITWLASEAWSTTTYIVAKDQSAYFSGTLGFAIPTCTIPGFDAFLARLQPLSSAGDIYVQEFWANVFGCTWASPAEGASRAGRPLCTGMERPSTAGNTFFDTANLRITCNVYSAVYAVAHALHNLLSCQEGRGPFSNGTCAKARDFEPWQLLARVTHCGSKQGTSRFSAQKWKKHFDVPCLSGLSALNSDKNKPLFSTLLHYMKNVQFVDRTGRKLYFDENGDTVPKYDIINWQQEADGSIVVRRVGWYDGSQKGQELWIDQASIIWNGNKKELPVSICSQSCPPGTRQSMKQGEPICCFDCVECRDGEISNGTDFTECIKCPEDYWSNKKRDECVPRQIEFLEFREPLGIVLTVLAVLGAVLAFSITGAFAKHSDTPLVRANNRELSFLLLGSLALCFLCALTFIGEPSGGVCVLRQVGFAVGFVLCISCILVKTIVVLLAFRMTTPNQNVMKRFRPVHQRAIVMVTTCVQIAICVGFLLSSPPSVHKNREAVIPKIFVECDAGSPLALFCVLAYTGFLAVINFGLAFLARNLPDNFNEAKFITFSLLVFVVVWITFIPAYISTKGKYLTAVEIFAILSSSFGLLACIFFPKCYVILIRPELNTKNKLIGRDCKGGF